LASLAITRPESFFCFALESAKAGCYRLSSQAAFIA
jgi:hypothetical protein